MHLYTSPGHNIQGYPRSHTSVIPYQFRSTRRSVSYRQQDKTCGGRQECAWCVVVRPAEATRKQEPPISAIIRVSSQVETGLKQPDTSLVASNGSPGSIPSSNVPGKWKQVPTAYRHLKHCTGITWFCNRCCVRLGFRLSIDGLTPSPHLHWQPQDIPDRGDPRPPQHARRFCCPSIASSLPWRSS